MASRRIGIARVDNSPIAAFYQHQQQPEQHDPDQTLSEVKDATLDSEEASCIALRSNCGVFSGNEAQSPSLQQGLSAPLVAELQTLRHQQAVEHGDEKHDSGIDELTAMLNR